MSQARLTAMSAKEHQREIITEKRAHALAMMLLTRREDLLIEEVKDDIGLDYIVRFHTQGKEGLREFGIELKAHRSAATKEQADRIVRPGMHQVQRYGPFPLPVCLFLFTMENDQGWYTWVAEPIESEDGKPGLRSCDKPDCRPLDNRALKQIIERVDVWYDAMFPSLITNEPAGNRNNRKRAK
jgi:hypothetical protein